MKNKKNNIKEQKPKFILFDLDGWQEIWQTITQNKMRSLLTAFGVFWGIFMLVVMVGFGTGIANATLGSVEKVSANSTFMFANTTSEPYMGFKTGREWNLVNEDLDALVHNFNQIVYATKVIFSRQSSTNNAVRGDKYGSYSVLGLSPDFNKIAPSRILQGRYINELDIQESRKVAVIGKRILNELFKPGEDPIGQLIRLNGSYYTVIGVVEPYNQNMQFFGPADEQIVIPLSTMQLAQNMGNKIDGIAVSTSKDVDVTPLEEEFHSLIKQRHQIAPTDEKAIQAFNVKRIFNMYQMLLMGINTLIWIVGLGTLLAGLVGVSNIMLVTVRERTQEIGVRRALGATPKMIMSQVLSESLVLTLIAGLLGLCAGIGVMSIVSDFFPANNSDSLIVDPQISFMTAVLAMVILVISGLIAGALPANRALQIKPIEALRDE